MQAVILCGGKGTRLREKTETLPKALVEIGGQPIVWHVIQWYAHHGVTRFLLLAGYLGERLAKWVEISHMTGLLEGLEVECVDTGEETPTGGRLERVRDRLTERFLCTYADGLSDLRLPDLLATHEQSGRLATLTAIQPRSQFGILELEPETGTIRRFVEKPQLPDWINGGFFVFEPGVLDYIGPHDFLERGPFERLAADRQFVAHQHSGFWACMDTYKDHEALDNMWRSGQAPWRLWR